MKIKNIIKVNLIYMVFYICALFMNLSLLFIFLFSIAYTIENQMYQIAFFNILTSISFLTLLNFYLWQDFARVIKGIK